MIVPGAAEPLVVSLPRRSPHSIGRCHLQDAANPRARRPLGRGLPPPLSPGGDSAAHHAAHSPGAAEPLAVGRTAASVAALKWHHSLRDNVIQRTLRGSGYQRGRPLPRSSDYGGPEGEVA